MIFKYASRMPERRTRFGCYRSDEFEIKSVKNFDELVEQNNGNIQAIAERFEQINSELKELKAKSGRLRVADSGIVGLRNQFLSSIEDAIISKQKEIKASAAGQLMTPYEFKTAGTIATANITGTNAPYRSYLEWQPGMEPTGQFHFRNLVRTILSETDNVSFPRAATPIGEGSFGRVDEGSTKPQIDRDWSMIDILLKPMAAYAIVQRQSLRNIIFLQQWLSTSMMDQLEDSEDTDFANQLVAAATGSTTTTKTVLPEKLISYMKNLISTKYNPTDICCDVSVWEDLLTFRPGTDNPYSLPGVVTVGPDGNIRLLNRPVRPVNWLTGRRVIVGDFTKAAIVQSESLVLRQSDSHASIFTANQIAFLLERTENLAVFRTNAFVTATV